MDISDSKKDRARRIISALYTPPGVVDAEDLILENDVYEEVTRMLSEAHELYVDPVSGKALLRWKPEYETGSEKMLDRTTQTERMVLFIIYLLYRHPFIPEEQRTGKPTEQLDVTLETIMRIAEKAKLNKVAVERALTRLSRLGYLEGTEWPKKTGLRLRALPNELYSSIEESAFRWNILVSAGIDDENGETKPNSETDNGAEIEQDAGTE
jgi:hypothetical protein